MLVDDDDGIREPIAKLLTALANVEVAGFASGAAALNALAAAPDMFEFIVSDLDMPGMSGIELCRRIRAEHPHLNILLATGSGVITHEEARGFGFCGMISKPFSVATLRHALADANVPNHHQPDQVANAPVGVAA